MRLFKLYCIFLFLVTYSAIASEPPSCQAIPLIFSKLGNIYYTLAPNHTIKITHSGKDSAPALSSDKKMIAFVRIGNQIIPKNCEDNTETKYGNQVWIYDISTKKERLLVANNFQCDTPERKIIDPTDITFSPDNKILYFITSGWTTSGALHGVNVDGTNQHYIIPANEFEVIPKGTYKGYLIVNEHRYFIPPGGSYDWYWLLSSDGKEEGAIGEEITKDQRNFLES